MSIGFLSLFMIVLMTLKIHGYVMVSWWVVFAPGIVDLMFSMYGYLRKRAINEAFMEILLDEGKEGGSNDK